MCDNSIQKAINEIRYTNQNIKNQHTSNTVNKITTQLCTRYLHIKKHNLMERLGQHTYNGIITSSKLIYML